MLQVSFAGIDQGLLEGSDAVSELHKICPNFILPISATICWVPAYSEDSSSDLRRGEFGRLVSIHSFLLSLSDSR